MASGTSAVLFGAAVYAYTVEPLLDTWLEVHVRATEARKVVADLRSLIRDRQAIEGEYRRLRGAVAVARSEEELTIALLREVDRLAVTTGLIISSTKPLKMTP